MTSSLEELAFKYGTDKRGSRHGYVQTYEELFGHWRNTPIRFLEIGVYNCGSHHMWADYFSKAQIYGIDTNNAQFEQYARPRLHLEKVDQGDRVDLTRYATHTGPWSVIIDDGSHKTSDQMTSFNVLWEHLKPSGYYVIEDTHSSYWNHLQDESASCMSLMLDITDAMSSAPHYKGYYANPKVRSHYETLNKWQQEIEYMRYQMGLLIIKKRQL